LHLLITIFMQKLFSTLQPDSTAPSLHRDCDKPFELGFNIMEHYKNLSLENIVEEIDGVVYTEEWRGIPNYEGLYQASTFGRIKVSGKAHPFIVKILKQSLKKNGYIYCHLTNKGKNSTKRVHRIIAQVFLDNPYNKPDVNHKFGNKHDNRVLMIEWVTKSENSLHAFNNNFSRSPKYWQGKTGDKHPCSKKVKQIDLNGNILMIYGSVNEAARNTKAFQSNILKVCNKQRITTAGYKWEYL